MSDCPQSIGAGTSPVGAAWKLTVYLRLFSMTLVSSPKASTRVGANFFTCSPPPHEASSSAVATIVAACRRPARHSSPNTIIQSPTRCREDRRPGSRCRRATQTIAHAFPLRSGRRLLDPDELRAFGIEFTQHRKQLLGRIRRPH